MNRLLLVLMLFASAAFATEYTPWTARDLELQPKATLLYQGYRTVQTVHRPRKYASQDAFFFLSLSTSFDRYAIELETAFAHTKHQRELNWDTIALTGRYRLKDDILGDPYTLIVGATLRQVLKLALHDVSCFYCGGLQGEFHASLGQEQSCGAFWHTRRWIMAAIGVGDHGSPYLRFKAAWERNWWDLHTAEIYLDTLWGLGKRSLHLHHFRGYGPIRHDSIDLGTRYTFTHACGVILGAGASYRLFAQNCPRGTYQFFVSLLYPFGL